MNLRKKIAQMLIMGFSGYEIDKESPISHWLMNEGIGGVLLFDYDISTQSYGKNLKNKEQIQKLNDTLRDFYGINHNSSTLPLLTAVDYEGGAVDRLKHVPGCMVTKKASEQALLSDEALFAEAEQMAILLKQLGFNLNFAPVVDLDLNGNAGIIGKLGRSFSKDPVKVTRAANLFAKAFRQHGIASSYKHFPGHGSASGDTHQDFVDVSKSFHSSELEPYQQLLTNHNAPIMVMTAHVINRKLDHSGLPATLSHSILNGVLREQLGFKGVIISDDLQMRAISKHYSLDDALSLTINAGADMLIFANQLGTITALEIIERIEQLVKSGVISEQRIEQAYQRIYHLKQQLLSLSSPASAELASKAYTPDDVRVKM